MDAVKLYAGLDINLLRAGIEESHRQGRHVLAHLVNATAEDAACAASDCDVHLAAWAAIMRGKSYLSLGGVSTRMKRRLLSSERK